MKSHAGKTLANVNKATANGGAQKQIAPKPAFQYLDHQAVLQRKQQEAANKSSPLKQLQVIQLMMNGHRRGQVPQVHNGYARPFVTAKAFSQKQIAPKPSFQHLDHRPNAVLQRKRQGAVNKSPQFKQTQAIQLMLNPNAQPFVPPPQTIVTVAMGIRIGDQVYVDAGWSAAALQQDLIARLAQGSQAVITGGMHQNFGDQYGPHYTFTMNGVTHHCYPQWNLIT